MNERLEKIMHALKADEKDMLYRHLWKQYVLEDMHSFIEILNFEGFLECDVEDEILDYAANLYVYEGEYDCNLTYWDNIGNVIEMAEERLNYGK